MATVYLRCAVVLVLLMIVVAFILPFIYLTGTIIAVKNKLFVLRWL